MRKWIVCVAVIAAAATVMRAQLPNYPTDGMPRPLAFDVASIKLNSSGEDRVTGGFLPGGRYRVTNYSLRSLIAAAYVRPQVTPDFLIAGGPDWIDTARFDIDAKAVSEFPSAPDGPSAHAESCSNNYWQIGLRCGSTRQLRNGRCMRWWYLTEMDSRIRVCAVPRGTARGASVLRRVRRESGRVP